MAKVESKASTGLTNAQLQALIKKVEKNLGKDALILGSDLKTLETPRATTGSLAFDLMLGGGWPLNQWNEIIGHESNGKTAMVMKTLAANMALNPKYTCLWVASEQFVPDWAETLGVDLSRLHLLDTNIMEDAFQVMHDWLESRAVDAVVLDSYPALIPKQEDDKAMDEVTMGGAKIMNLFMRKSGMAIKRSMTEPDRPVLGFIINQWREKIGVMHGDPRTTPGGKGKNFSFFTRVEVSRTEWLKDGDDKVGIAIKAHTIKNKTYQQGRMAVVDFYTSDTADGLHKAGDYDRVKELCNIAMVYDIIERAGAWYNFGDQKWQGREAVFEQVKWDLDLQKALDDEVRRYVLRDADVEATTA